MKSKLPRTIALSILSCMSVTAHEHNGVGDMPVPAQLGTVSFENSCKPQLRAEFNRGVALLHSFWQDEAQRTFDKVSLADADCAMAYWGVAMTHFHQFLDRPSPTDLAAGNKALAKADAAREKSAREAAYIHALHLFYNAYSPANYFTNAKRYSDAMGAVARDNPDDLEAKAFYALSLLASDPPDDIDLVNPKRAVAILYPIFREHPDHPGIAHYIIHACDSPKLAQQGVEAARRYALIAPASPHALHMPSHIFSRLGLWQDDIRSNLASKAASESTTAMHVGAENRLHAMEFLEYAYLQIGHDDEAQAIVAAAKTVKQSDVDSRYSDYYPIVEARVPALFAIETQNWTMAMNLQTNPGADSFGDELTLLARAIAAGHLHDPTAAEKAARAIDALKKNELPHPAGSGPDTVRAEIHAWVDFAKDDLSGAVALLRPIADRQDKLGKEEVELPAREMLAEMFLIDGNADEALKEYQASLSSDPNRFNALLGAANAAEQLGQRGLSAMYYRTLLSNCAEANGNALQRLDHARAVVRERPI
jgi:tetratricopeptide (TPR) repeat protein